MNWGKREERRKGRRGKGNLKRNEEGRKWTEEWKKEMEGKGGGGKEGSVRRERERGREEEGKEE